MFKIVRMEHVFTRMIQFTLLVKAGGRLREFNFRKLKDSDTERISGNVCDDRGDRIVFGMQKQQEEWKIESTNLPGWITQNEDKLSQAVEQELSRW